MIAFAGNSLLCRIALKHTAIDPATFTSIRMLCGAIALWLIKARRPSAASGQVSKSKELISQNLTIFPTIANGVADLGKLEEIGRVFPVFQRYVYQPQGAAA